MISGVRPAEWFVREFVKGWLTFQLREVKLYDQVVIISVHTH